MTDSPFFLLLETATDSCSAAVSKGDKILSQKYICTPKAHAIKLAVFVEELLEEHEITMDDIAAVGVSKGPGSYTGLRVGVSLAKGLCMGTNIPLIGIGTLDVISQMAIDDPSFIDLGSEFIIVPMIDAGRMEVYTAVFNSKGEQLTPVEAKILDDKSFDEYLAENRVLFTGNGAQKFKPLVENNPNAYFANHLPHASGLRVKVLEKYKNKELEDIAYFQPFYLKDFVAGKPKKLL